MSEFLCQDNLAGRRIYCLTKAEISNAIHQFLCAVSLGKHWHLASWKCSVKFLFYSILNRGGLSGSEFWNCLINKPASHFQQRLPIFISSISIPQQPLLFDFPSVKLFAFLSADVYADVYGEDANTSI